MTRTRGQPIKRLRNSGRPSSASPPPITPATEAAPTPEGHPAREEASPNHTALIVGTRTIERDQPERDQTQARRFCRFGLWVTPCVQERDRDSSPGDDRDWNQRHGDPRDGELERGRPLGWPG